MGRIIAVVTGVFVVCSGSWKTALAHSFQHCGYLPSISIWESMGWDREGGLPSDYWLDPDFVFSLPLWPESVWERKQCWWRLAHPSS